MTSVWGFKSPPRTTENVVGSSETLSRLMPNGGHIVGKDEWVGFVGWSGENLLGLEPEGSYYGGA